MNFLAHLYLSGESDDIKIGNFIGDYVKGHDYNKYPEEIKKGILMHRAIDAFTDTHPMVKKCSSFYKDKYNRYAGIVIDIVFDHFLAIDWKIYSNVLLADYINAVHYLLQTRFHTLPRKVQDFVPAFINSNWLTTYKTLYGIEKVLKRMAVRTSLPNHADMAANITANNYDILRAYFNQFFPLLKEHVTNTFGVELP